MKPTAPKNNVILAIFLVSACLGAICLALAFAFYSPSPKTADDYIHEYGGNREIYDRILSSTDCAALQSEFAQTAANNARESPGTPPFRWTLGYMKASENRMKQIGCHP